MKTYNSMLCSKGENGSNSSAWSPVIEFPSGVQYLLSQTCLGDAKDTEAVTGTERRQVLRP